MTLKIQRLEMRPYSPGNLLALIEGADAFHRSFGKHVAADLRGLYVSGEVSPRWLEQLREAKQPDPWTFGFAVIDQASDLVIGSAGFKGPPNAEGVVEAAYGIAPSFEGKGFATEALRELVSFAFGDSQVRVIRAHTLPANNASTRVLLKNRFRKLGEVVEPEDGLVWRWELERGDAAAKQACLIRVVLPYHLRNLARVDGEVALETVQPTIAATLDALEARFPVLRGTIRDHGTLKRRPFIRFFACKEDLSLEPPETPLPEAVISGTEPFLVVGAMAGG